jgi:dipeptide/tripeptide permease
VTKQIYHGFVSLSHFSSLFGSILADNYFGHFRVILWVSVLYVFGHLMLSVGAVPFLGEAFKSWLDYSGLFVIALATGGIKPCVSAFAADQFAEDQKNERRQFFSVCFVDSYTFRGYLSRFGPLFFEVILDRSKI